MGNNIQAPPPPSGLRPSSGRRLQGYYIELDDVNDRGDEATGVKAGAKLNAFVKELMKIGKKDGIMAAGVDIDGMGFHALWPIFTNAVTESQIRDCATEADVIVVTIAVP